MKLVLLIASLTTIMGDVVGLVEVAQHGSRGPIEIFDFVKNDFKYPG